METPASASVRSAGEKVGPASRLLAAIVFVLAPQLLTQFGAALGSQVVARGPCWIGTCRRGLRPETGLTRWPEHLAQLIASLVSHQLLRIPLARSLSRLCKDGCRKYTKGQENEESSHIPRIPRWRHAQWTKR